ncbi:MAG: YigZ family protein [Cyclobacteriaceae bacterium]|nr:YigZ family protein [Cyclobacteriaceae bacterium HetDA_MAG_MS6]
MNAFRVLNTSSEGLYKEKGSKFIAFAEPVSSEEDVKRFLEILKKKYHDARHHCYAYVIGLAHQSYRANDDGEPNHSAGDPILGQIRSFELTNTMVVVVRYFGGTKLGVSGLINAYRTATENALRGATIREVFPQREVRIQFSYDRTSLVERLLAEFDLEYLERQYQESCSMKLLVRESDIEKLQGKFIPYTDIEILQV